MVYVRWADDRPIAPTGSHPVNNNYPFNAWQAAETVVDSYWLPHRFPLADTREIEVALGPAFADPADLSWQMVAQLDLGGVTRPALLPGGVPARVRGDKSAISSLRLPQDILPGRRFEIEALGEQADRFVFYANERPIDGATRLPAGDYQLSVALPGEALTCGWLSPQRSSCPLRDYRVEGVALPAGATNFGDQIALTKLEVADSVLEPGGRFEVTFHWLALSNIQADYTVFVQILSEEDEIVGQIDAKPLQGTKPTETWAGGETIVDPYQLWLDPEMAPGPYRLIVGFYTLADLRRLPVVTEDGVIWDDKFTYRELKVE